MSLSSSVMFVKYTGNGSTATYSVTFDIFANTDLELIVTDADGTVEPLTYGPSNDFTVSSALDSITSIVCDILKPPPKAPN